MRSSGPMLPVAHANISNLSRRNAAMFEPAQVAPLATAALLDLFSSSVLKHYLYQADPELYRTWKRRSYFSHLAIPAYKKLYLTAIISTVVLSVLWGLL